MSWIESPNVICLMVPEDVPNETGDGTCAIDDIAQKTGENIARGEPFSVLSMSDPRFVEAVDFSLDGLRKELVANWEPSIVDRNAGVFVLTDTTGKKPPVRKHLRVIILGAA